MTKERIEELKREASERPLSFHCPVSEDNFIGEALTWNELRTLLLCAEEVEQWHSALHKHFEAIAVWTKEFQPGGYFNKELDMAEWWGADISVKGGKWLVEEVKRLRADLEERDHLARERRERE